MKWRPVCNATVFQCKVTFFAHIFIPVQFLNSLFHALLNPDAQTQGFNPYLGRAEGRVQGLDSFSSLKIVSVVKISIYITDTFLLNVCLFQV